MSNVRAKFRVSNKVEVDEGFQISLEPVTCGSEENENFYRYTPWGKIELGTVNHAAAESFEVGAEYYVDFSKAV